MTDFLGFLMFVFFILFLLNVCLSKILQIQNSLNGRDPNTPSPKHNCDYMDVPPEDEFLNKNNSDDWL
jgi:hypothetical protein